MKGIMVVLCCLMALPAVCGADNMVIGKVNTQELYELCMEKVAEIEENRALKEKMDALDRSIQQIHRQMQGVKEEEKKGELQDRVNEMSSERYKLEQKLQTQIKALIIKTAREIGRNRFILIFEEGYDASILYKSTDIVDITVDVRDALLGIRE